MENSKNQDEKIQGIDFVQNWHSSFIQETNKGLDKSDRTMKIIIGLGIGLFVALIALSLIFGNFSRFNY